MLKVQPWKYTTNISFCSKKNNQTSQEIQQQKERNILTSADALLLYCNNISSKTREMLQQLREIAIKGYPANELNELEYKAIEAVKIFQYPLNFQTTL